MAASQHRRPGTHWFVSDGYIWDDHPISSRREGGRPLECSSRLFLYNPQARPAAVTVRLFHVDREPTVVAVTVAAGCIEQIELAALPEVPHRQAFWITVESDIPILPQARHEDFTFWDPVPDAMVSVAPYPGPLEDETNWMFIDCFQGDCGSWYERESISILNPSPEPAIIRVRYLFRLDAGGAEEKITIPGRRVAFLHGEDRFPRLMGIQNGPAVRLRWEYNVRIDADRPVIAQSTRRARWVGFPSIIGSRSTMAVPVRPDWPDRWHYPGGEIVDYGLLPRPREDTHPLNQCDNTWDLLFIANPRDDRPAQARLTIHKPDGGSLAAEPMTVPPNKSVLQCLHAKPWLGPFTRIGEPFAMTVTGDGPLAPSVCGAEFEMWSQVCPGAMTAVNFHPGPLTDETAWWLGIGQAGGADTANVEWQQSYHLFNPGDRPVRAKLSFLGLDGPESSPLTFPVSLAAEAVVRIRSEDVPRLPMGQPFAVKAEGDGPFCAQVFGRAFARGLPHSRSMYSFIGVPMGLKR